MFLNDIHYKHNTQTSCNIYVFLPSQPAKPEDLCMVCYTSGTTGEQHVWIATRLLHTRLLLKLLDYCTCLYFCFKLLFSLLIYFTVVKTDQFLKYFLISYAAQILNIHPVYMTMPCVAIICYNIFNTSFVVWKIWDSLALYVAGSQLVFVFKLHRSRL